MQSKLDIVIIAASKSKELINITEQAITSAVGTCNNIYVVETFNKNVNYNNAKMLYDIQKDNFNYNRTINKAFNQTKSEYVGFFNNDVIFTENWGKNLIKEMEEKRALSGSPFCPLSMTNPNNLKSNYGYEVRTHLAGWAIVVNRKVFEIIGKFDETFNFWRSDNVYAKQIKNKGIKHIVCYNSIVKHVEKGSQTLKKELNQTKLTHSEYTKKLNLKYDTRFSIIMPCFLGAYQGAAKNRPQKLRRAIKSVLKQTFTDFELIVISDGCDKTIEIYQEFASDDRIKCIQIPKQDYMSGNVRNAGLKFSKGQYTIYLDSDDYYESDHLQKVNSWLKDDDVWIYYNDKKLTDNKGNTAIKKVQLQMASAGTSSICHKNDLDVKWGHGYTHDFRFIQELMNFSKGRKCGDSGYIICHTPSTIDL